MKLIHDTDIAREIEALAYTMSAGRVMLQIQYCRVQGFLICISSIFSEDIFGDSSYERNQELQSVLEECVKKNDTKKSYTVGDETYQFLYITEEALRRLESNLTLPGFVKAPAKIQVLWLDSEKNLHNGNNKVLIPISVKVEKSIRKKGIINKNEFIDIKIKASTVAETQDAALYYKINNKNLYYPIPNCYINDSTLSIKKSPQMDIMVGVFPEYKEIYRVDN